MAAILVLRRGNEPEHRITMDRARITVGRSLENDFPSPSDAMLSREHFVIEKVQNRWIVRDLQSRNGTFVNGQRITVHGLASGDLITAGRIEAELKPSESEELETATTLDNVLRSALTPSSPAVERYMTALVKAGRELADSRDLDRFGSSLLNVAVDALEAERGVVLVENGGEWTVAASRGDFEISGSVRARVIRDRVSLLVRDVGLDEDLGDAPNLVLQRVRSLIAVPLQTARGVLGLVYVDRRRLPEFNLGDLNLLTVLANMAALRLEQARLAEMAERERERTREIERQAAAHRRAVEAAELLRYAETRAILAETAASMKKVAAAISHELNTPLGALNSSVETLMAAINRGRAGGDLNRILSITETLSNTIKTSTSRISEIIGRLQRLTNLDGAELQVIDLGQFIGDVIVARQTSQGVSAEVDASIDQRVVSRPQQLAGVFSALLERAPGKVRLTVRTVERGVQVQLHAPELVITEQDIVDLFDPAFRVAAGRIASTNWNLFTARQMIRELGGDIQADSDEVRGTVFTVLISDLSA